MIGGVGNDTYVVDNAGDVVTEAPAKAPTRCSRRVSYTLAANVENLTLTGGGNINGTGNALANVITGNGGNNILTGGGGADTLNGGSASTRRNTRYHHRGDGGVRRRRQFTVTTGGAEGTDTLSGIEKIPRRRNLKHPAGGQRRLCHHPGGDQRRGGR